jgi:thiol-disulfide isomerase/thioredoxin
MSEPAPDLAPTGDEGRSRPSVTWWLLALSVAAVAALGVLFTTVGYGSGDDDPGGASDTALAIPVTAADGSSTSLADYAGQPLVVNFFASWCPPCRAEMPELERVHSEVGDEVRFVGVSVDYDETTWKSLVAESGITFETVFEPRQDLLRAVGGKGMPTTILVSAEGRIVHVHTGALDDDALRRLIDERLAA